MRFEVFTQEYWINRLYQMPKKQLVKVFAGFFLIVFVIVGYLCTQVVLMIDTQNKNIEASDKLARETYQSIN